MNGLTPYNMKIVAEVLAGSSYNFQLLNLVGSQPVIVDCGANIGSFSLACKTRKPNCKIVAVEPDSDSFDALKTNLARFDSITLVQAALTDKNGMVNLNSGENDGVANSIFAGKMVSESSSTVESKATAEFLGEVKRHNQVIDVLKMDTEGGEWFLLDTPTPILAEIGVIYMEYHSANFLPRLIEKLDVTHVVYEAKIRFPHRGEIAWVRRDLVPVEQRAFEITPFV
ncbi:MAG: FkbM family methyltransferase [Gallionella sp.]|nr:FkbM family methyltransferase [Gallionella sp.]